jgi:type I restriction enzyme M protein
MPRLSLAKLERHLLGAADRLRQEGLDAATYKDYILGMLFLKRCSDSFDAEYERIVSAKVAQGVDAAEAKTKYGENPDYYDGFFVPQRARWNYLQDKLNDATVVYGNVLDTALGAVSEANDSLEHVLDHISFMRTQGNKRVVSDDACKDLVRHFSKYRLRNEDFQFSDLLGSAYEYLINMFAESAGKKGGDFYTPRDVIRLMVRILKPTPGMSVYDPCCGSGGMLIITREYVEDSGGDPTNLRLCGQGNDAAAWSICKLNMLLHGIPGADIQLEDTLLHPLHREAGELERFDRVITNPPFSQNYTRSNMEFPERFRWGWAPTMGKKADLMFAQHMLAVCKDGGVVATVMPHGVLFRGGDERKIRKNFLEQDLIEAIISLPPNLFYGAGIPACILIMRPNLSGRAPNPNKPTERRERILFINADAEFQQGRAQNYLQPEHVEKIVSTFERYQNVPGYARVVSLAELASDENDFNLNIRRYVDNSPPPEPHDVRAHLVGGVPVAEVEAQRSIFEGQEMDPTAIFQPRDERYFDFVPALAERSLLAATVDSNAGVVRRAEKYRAAIRDWWNSEKNVISDLPTTKRLMEARHALLDSFVGQLSVLDTLDRFKLAGVIATWWTDTLPDLKTLMEHGFAGVIEGWIDAIADAVEDDDNAGPTFDPFAHKLVLRTMSDYLEDIAKAKAEIARLKGAKEAFEQSNAPEDPDEEEQAKWNYAKDLESQIKEAKDAIKEKLRAAKPLADKLKSLGKKAKAAEKSIAALSGEGTKSIARARKKGLPTAELEEALRQSQSAACQDETDQLTAQLDAVQKSCEPDRQRIASIEEELKPYEAIKQQLAEARARFRTLTAEFVNELKSRCDAMNADQKRALVLELFALDVQAGLHAAVSEKRQGLVRYINSLWDKYRVTLTNLRTDRAIVEDQVNEFMKKLSYQ